MFIQSLYRAEISGNSCAPSLKDKEQVSGLLVSHCARAYRIEYHRRITRRARNACREAERPLKGIRRIGHKDRIERILADGKSGGCKESWNKSDDDDDDRDHGRGHREKQKKVARAWNKAAAIFVRERPSWYTPYTGDKRHGKREGKGGPGGGQTMRETREVARGEVE